MSYLGNKPSDVFPSSFTVTNATVEGAFTSQGIDDNADATAITIDSSENVGIGTSSPSGKLNLATGASTACELRLTSNNTGSGAGDRGRIVVYSSRNDGTAYEAGKIEIDRSTGTTDEAHMLFATNGGSGNTERMRIDSSGNLLVGKTASDNSTVGTRFQSDGFASLVRDGDASLLLRRNTSDGNILRFNKAGTDVGSIASVSGGMSFFATGVNNCGWYLTNNSAMLPMKNSALSDNLVDLGSTSYRFDDIFATNGTIITSDQNEKNIITDSDLGIDFIKRLTPKSYIFNGKTRTHYGLIAQDVETVLSDISKPTSGFAGFIKDDISEEQDGSEYRYGLRYTEFVAPLIQAVKDQQAIIEDLQAKVTSLETENATQATQITDLINRVTALENA